MANNSFLKNKVRNIILLIASELLLTTFVGYWLVTQYQNEKLNLSSDLHQLYYQARQDMANRQVYECVIYPIFQHLDTSNIDSIQFKHIQIENNAKRKLVKEVVELINKDRTIISVLDNCLCGEYPAEKVNEDSKSIYDEIFTIMHRNGIRANYVQRQNFNNNNSIPYDHLLFKSLYESLIKSEGINIQPTWINQDQSIPLDEAKLLIERYNFETKSYETHILFDQYRGYVFTNILPQFMFVFILLSLTSFALIFTYRGYIKQMRLNVLRSDFINNITHELKIPVATAKAALEALRSFGLKADTNTTEEYLEMVSKEMNRLDSLTTRVLEHAKLEGQKHHLNITQTDLTNFSEHIVKSMGLLVKSKEIDLSFTSPEQAILANIDTVYIEGVIKNLVDNSVKYAGKKAIIQLVLWQDENNAYLSVSDNGPGIPKEYINKVFDKFFRVPKGDTHNVKGYGLGLSFADLVMQHHNGSIKAENIKDGGCRFTLRFPIA